MSLVFQGLLPAFPEYPFNPDHTSLSSVSNMKEEKNSSIVLYLQLDLAEQSFEVRRMVDMEARESERARAMPRALKKKMRKAELSRLRSNTKK